MSRISDLESPNLLAFENQQWSQGRLCIAGVDEAGRGPLAGPVVAAVAVFDRAFAEREYQHSLADLTDSKQLSEEQRNAFLELLEASEHVRIGVGVATVSEIDSVNILRATHLAMKRAVLCLDPLPDHILVDGRPVPGLPVASTAIVKGDTLSLSIAAASVVAKVTRDRMLYESGRIYPQYGFAKHKGYGTKAHIAALNAHGPTPEHRLSFRPVREAAELHPNNATAPRIPASELLPQGELFED